MNIRTANINFDLPGIVRVINAIESQPVTIDQLRGWFQYTPPGRIQLRLVGVEDNDTVIAYSGFVHEASSTAGHFKVWVEVAPAFQGRGFGSALWNATQAYLLEQGATRLESDVYDNDPVSLGFAEGRGFTIDHNLFHSILDLAVFDETPYLSGIAALEAKGIRFCSLADFPDTPETRHKLHNLNATNELDIPNQNGNQTDYPIFEKFVIGGAWFRREGQLLAVDGDTWAGLSAISLKPETQSAYNEHTGVLRAYRGRKIAQSLKVLAARYARQHGALRIETDNDSLNVPMLAINQKLGYQPQPPGTYMLVRRPGENNRNNQRTNQHLAV